MEELDAHYMLHPFFIINVRKMWRAIIGNVLKGYGTSKMKKYKQNVCQATSRKTSQRKIVTIFLTLIRSMAEWLILSQIQVGQFFSNFILLTIYYWVCLRIPIYWNFSVEAISKHCWTISSYGGIGIISYCFKQTFDEVGIFQWLIFFSCFRSENRREAIHYFSVK